MTSVRLRVKVVPKASKDEVAGWIGDALRVRVTAAPERGKANEAVLHILGRVLGLSRQDIRLVAGAASERKIVEVHGIDEGELKARLARRSNEKR